MLWHDVAAAEDARSLFGKTADASCNTVTCTVTSDLLHMAEAVQPRGGQEPAAASGQQQPVAWKSYARWGHADARWKRCGRDSA